MFTDLLINLTSQKTPRAILQIQCPHPHNRAAHRYSELEREAEALVHTAS